MESILLVGTGRMARAYATVLSDLPCSTTAIGRSEEGAKAFQDATNIPTMHGGIETWERSGSGAPTHAIIAVGVEQLANVAAHVIRVGVKNILLEKPGALNQNELAELAKQSSAAGVKISIAYNRRYLSSTLRARNMIKEDGGVTSFYFEFNERLTQPQVLKDLKIDRSVVEQWFIANSTHVVDLAFYLAGWPRELKGFTAAGPLWAPHPTLFCGSGITANDIPFSYYSNWELPGPWSVEIGTLKRKLILSPLESLKVEKDGVVEEIRLENNLDIKYRPGLFQEVKSFLSENSDLPTIDTQIEHFKWYEKIWLGS